MFFPLFNLIYTSNILPFLTHKVLLTPGPNRDSLGENFALYFLIPTASRGP